MVNAERKAREVKGLKPSLAEAQRHGVDLGEFMKRLTDHSLKIEKLRGSLENLHEARGEDAPRARPIQPFKASDARTSQTRP